MTSHSVIQQRTGTMPWSPFIESCAAKLSQECEFSTDRYLLGQVQVQHMLGQIDSLVARGFGENKAPVDIEVMISSLQSAFEECKARLPVPIDHDGELIKAFSVRHI